MCSFHSFLFPKNKHKNLIVGLGNSTLMNLEKNRKQIIKICIVIFISILLFQFVNNPIMAMNNVNDQSSIYLISSGTETI